MVLSHFTGKKFVFDPLKKYNQKDMGNFKPRGLWLSDETANLSWSEWCKGESWGLERLNHKTDFLCQTSSWLVLKNSNEILAFTDEFSIEMYPGAQINKIDWFRVVREYSGILITPYDYHLRLHAETHWYYGWDCASACVWDLSTISIF